MSSSNSSTDMSSLESKQAEAQSQYIELANNQIENQMAAQKAQFAKEAAEAWSKAQ